MDGQLGVNGENSVVPCLLEQFLELGHPDSLTDESEVKSKASLKVLKNSIIISLKKILGKDDPFHVTILFLVLTGLFCQSGRDDVFSS